ncbi:MAG: hypothetical protein E7662_00340 [Ruminococcaceae bacterium]|nr:hypothetical protein [Oscillospiraceae bacterium]
MKQYKPEIFLLLYGIGIFYLIPGIVTLCGGNADEKLYMILAVLLPEAVGVILYTTRRRRYLFPALCMSFLPLGYGIFLYPWHVEVWYSYYPDMGMCLITGAVMAFFHVFIVLVYVLIGALAGGIADWEQAKRIRSEEKLK